MVGILPAARLVQPQLFNLRCSARRESRPEYRPAAPAGSTTGAGCQRAIFGPAQGEVFSLDIPFYRTCVVARAVKAVPSIAQQRPLAAPQGLDVRELSSAQRREKCFLLTSPFIEPSCVLPSRSACPGHPPSIEPARSVVINLTVTGDTSHRK